MNERRRCIFVGYSYGKKGWRVYDLKTGEIFTLRDVSFYENSFPLQVSGTSREDVGTPLFLDVYDSGSHTGRHEEGKEVEGRQNREAHRPARTENVKGPSPTGPDSDRIDPTDIISGRASPGLNSPGRVHFPVRNGNLTQEPGPISPGSPAHAPRCASDSPDCTSSTLGLSNEPGNGPVTSADPNPASSADPAQENLTALRRSDRIRGPPLFLKDFVCHMARTDPDSLRSTESPISSGKAPVKLRLSSLM
ncbi:hypothetical protein CRG98_022584 [Punica granatum]|uniref:Retroviral polymerase SH3-like domain-containing protein n=1 Tax=Punica granatum TaxID=22663 RepID=A0A2I0JME9_PUNGR|nr:hypothetical protein CRG98_022584 [Punica granatum]